MTISLKYAHIERERRWLLAGPPELAGSPAVVTDHYLIGTRLRLREVAEAGSVVRKLGHKVRLDDGPGEVACTSFYLDHAEWSALTAVPAHTLRKKRWRVVRDGQRVAVDVFGGHAAGLVLAEVDRGAGPDRGLPPGLDAVAEVTLEEAFTGAALAGSTRERLVRAVARHGLILSP